MGILDRLFPKNRAKNQAAREATAADLVRSRKLSGRETG